MTLAELHQQVTNCKKCSLRAEATQPVPGLGELGAQYFLLGEAPGKHEDQAGVPFVGAAGKRLNKLLALGGIDANDCYITNVVKCRPPTNRTPRKAERLSCYYYLQEEIRLIQPKYIVALGATPLSLFTDNGISQMHGTMFEYELNES
tara:strand:+ start:181 stop:624 length:444 start_codon:yes stop_codon:yes gene_type:complete